MRASRSADWTLSLFLLCAASGGWAADYALLEDEPGEYTASCRVTAPAGWGADTEARIAFDFVGPDDLAYARVAGGRAAVLAVAGGRVQAVGEARVFQPPKSFTMAVQRRAGRVRLIADGRVLLDLDWKRPLGGRAGTLAAGGAQVSEAVVQPIAPPLVRDDFTRDEGETGGWQVLSGTWRNTMISAPKADAARSANPFSVRASGTPEALMMMGDWFWDTYRARVAVKSVGAASVGLCAYVQSAGDMIQFRWEAGSPDAAHAKKLLWVRQGKTTLLAEAPGGLLPEQWYQLALDVQPGKVTALIDRYPVLSAATDAFGQGGVGLLCAAGDAVFDDVVVAPAGTPEADAPAINPVFVADETMAANQLYLPSGLWRAPEGGVTWNWGDYTEGVSLRLPASALTADPLTVLLRAPSTDAAGAAAAYAVTVRRDGDKLVASLKAPPDKAASGACPVGTQDEVAVSMAGDTVAVHCGAAQALSFKDPTPLAGRDLGLAGAVGNLTNIAQITSSHALDYTFDATPTDWFAGKGLWQVTTRWPCQPGWTFFGGTHDENPVLWTKHRYEGDVVLEFFAGLPMDCPPPPGYTRPSDLDAALCGDGVDLGSGYQFVIAGWKNSKSAILRRGQIVAENTGVVFVNPVSSNFAFHRHWFRVRAEKIGSRVALSLDGQLVASYEDPDPLPGGRAAVWSFHNGLMVGRARLWFEQERQGGVVPPVSPAAVLPPTPRSAEAPVADDFETSEGEWQTFNTPATVELAIDNSTSAGGKRSLRVTNLISGGSFGAYAVTTAFRATDFPRLSFDYRLPPGVQVNLYVYLNDRWHAIVLNAEEPPSSATTLLGHLANVQTDDKWHHAEFDLLAPLQTLYPQLKAFTVKYLALAAPEESYLRCGIGGNGRGARFWVDNFRLGPR